MIIASMYPSPFDMEEAHDQNSCLIVGEKFYAYEEEKLTSVKSESTVRFPERSLMMGMKELNVFPNEVDYWVFTKPAKIDLEYMQYFFSYILKAYTGNRQEFGKWFKKKVKFVTHQIAHASLGVYGSNFNECVFLCLDGGGDPGDQRNFIFGEYTNEKFKILKSSKGLKNIGVFHAFIADSLGFPGNDNGKVSGFAGYGKVIPELEKKFRSFIKINEDGIIFERKRYNFTTLE